MAVAEKQISELEDFFRIATLPGSVQLDAGSRIINARQFINSHLNFLRSNGDKPIYDVFHIRLLRLKEILSIKPTAFL